MQPRGTGPWRVTAVHENGGAELQDPFTGRPLLGDLTGLPDHVSSSRLLRFEVPEDGFGEEGPEELDLHAVVPGQLVAWQCEGGVHLLRAEKVVSAEYVEGRALEGTSVPAGREADQEWEETETRYRVFWWDLLCRVLFGTGRRLHERSREAINEAQSRHK